MKSYTFRKCRFDSVSISANLIIRTYEYKHNFRKGDTIPISKLGKRRQVVIPKNICEQLSLQEGDYVEINLKGNMVMIKPKKLVDADDVLSPQEAKIVQEGESQIKHGKGIVWGKAKQSIKL